MLKKHFERNDLKKKLNQYNINSVCRFLEEIYGKVLVSNINDLNQFIDDFNNCLDLLKPKARELLINKYGLRDGVKKLHQSYLLLQIYLLLVLGLQFIIV